MKELFYYPGKLYEIWYTYLRGFTLVTDKIISTSKLFFQQLYIFVSFLNSKCSSSRNGTKTFHNIIQNSIRSITIFPTLFFSTFIGFWERGKFMAEWNFQKQEEKKEKGETLEKYSSVNLLSFPKFIGWDNPNPNEHETLTSLYRSLQSPGFSYPICNCWYPLLFWSKMHFLCSDVPPSLDGVGL